MRPAQIAIFNAIKSKHYSRAHFFKHLFTHQGASPQTKGTMSQKPKPKSKPTAAQKPKPKAAPTHVTILGETLDIAFNMAVELNYERISGEAFTIDALAKMTNSIALYMAAILEANPDTTITVERLLKEAKGPEISALSNAVITAMTEWMQIPSVITDKETDDSTIVDKPDAEESVKN